MKLYAHPFATYRQKVLIALYENGTPFELRLLVPDDEQAAAEHEALWPLKRMPVLVDGGRTVVESSIIIEHLALRHPGPVRLIPDDPRASAYRWLDDAMAEREWTAGGAFSLADCAAAPALADWAHPIAEALANVRAYRRRLSRGPPSRGPWMRRGPTGRRFRSAHPTATEVRAVVGSRASRSRMGLSYELAVVRPWGGTLAHLRDPDGNVLTFLG